jgi:hypothetical protein
VSPNWLYLRGFFLGSGAEIVCNVEVGRMSPPKLGTAGAAWGRGGKEVACLLKAAEYGRFWPWDRGIKLCDIV